MNAGALLYGEEMNQANRLKLFKELKKIVGEDKARTTKSGFLVVGPLGTTSWHRSGEADPHTARNIKRQVERVGLPWPLKGF